MCCHIAHFQIHPLSHAIYFSRVLLNQQTSPLESDFGFLLLTALEALRKENVRTREPPLSPDIVAKNVMKIIGVRISEVQVNV